MGLLTRLERVAGYVSVQPTIDDWVLEGGENGVRKVWFELCGQFEYADGVRVAGKLFKCELRGRRNGVYFNVDGYANTTGDAFVDALRRLNESGVMG